MSAAAVIYVGDLGRMRAFYQGCFQLTTADSGPGYHGLRSDSWLLTLVQSAAAVPTTNPPTRRADTPIKLSFQVASIDALRPLAASLGGQSGPPETAWEFRHATHCDCLDPEGNVISLTELTS